MGIIKNKTNNDDQKKKFREHNFENRYLYNDARDKRPHCPHGIRNGRELRI